MMCKVLSAHVRYERTSMPLDSCWVHQEMEIWGLTLSWLTKSEFIEGDRKGSRVAMSTDSHESPLLELIFFPSHLTRLGVSGVFEFFSMHP
ncbi:MAG: hypothetical protein KC587_04005 [Nitrospira sp.]|nr:hypothetical protein [Nitrospira sp.]MCA9455802.1 hypothetical protein [Nitrospira sp.]